MELVMMKKSTSGRPRKADWRARAPEILGVNARVNLSSVMEGVALQRNVNGVKGTSLVLPMVLGVGVVAENDGLEEGIEMRGMYGIEEGEEKIPSARTMAAWMTPLMV